MSKTTTVVIGGLVILIAIAYYLLQMPISPPPNAKMLTIPVTITLSGSTCTLSTGPNPIKLDSGDQVDWQEDQQAPFTVDFFGGSAVSTGSPFRNSLNNGWQTRFASNDGKPVQSKQAELTGLEKLFGVHDFPILQISVNGKPCYDGKNNPIPAMKVHVN